MSHNLDLWKAVEKTPTAHTKAITGKPYSGTSPKPYYLVQKATEMFGPCGIGWGYSIHERVEDGAPGEKLHIAHVKLWYEWNGKRGEVEHVGQTMFSGVRSNGKPYTDEDAPKKSVTDALVKALSMIGFAGDIFMGRYDDSKYVNELRDEERAPPVATPSKPIAKPEFSIPAKVMVATIDALKSRADVTEWVFANKMEAEKLRDGEAVLDYARNKFKALPEDVVQAAE